MANNYQVDRAWVRRCNMEYLKLEDQFDMDKKINNNNNTS